MLLPKVLTVPFGTKQDTSWEDIFSGCENFHQFVFGSLKSGRMEREVHDPDENCYFGSHVSSSKVNPGSDHVKMHKVY